MKYTVQQLAKSAGISVRTLHYYDEIGLLKPSRTEHNGYRTYNQNDLILLQQILFFKELDFSLEDISAMLHAPHFNVHQALQDQRKLLVLKKERLENILHSIDTTIQTLKGGDSMKSDDMFNALSDAQLEEYKKEAKQRWGHTKAYQQSVERTKHWTKEDYKRIQKDGEKLTQEIADSMSKGIDHPDVQKMIQRHYEGIQVFYDCPLDFYKNLGQMYVDDSRFTAFYDTFAPGLAVFMRDAIAYYVDQHRDK